MLGLMIRLIWLNIRKSFVDLYKINLKWLIHQKYNFLLWNSWFVMIASSHIYIILVNNGRCK